MSNKKFIDLVIGGPDMSGTSTQISQMIDYFQKNNLVVKDLRGGEIDALFHAEEFYPLNLDYISLTAFLNDNFVSSDLQSKFFKKAHKLLDSLQVASFVDNDSSTFVDPNKADVWVLEEPPKRGAGLDIRSFELNRSKYYDSHNPLAEALLFQACRSTEFFRFRKIARELGKIVLRSRSEESACYQIEDTEHLPDGISKNDYLNLPGHKIAFGNAPTDIFIVHAGKTWTAEEYKSLKEQRAGNRVLDDHELMVDYQLLVNKRYSSDWLEALYESGCTSSSVPTIHRFDMYDENRNPRLPEPIKEDMYSVLEGILDRYTNSKK